MGKEQEVNEATAGLLLWPHSPPVLSRSFWFPEAVLDLRLCPQPALEQSRGAHGCPLMQYHWKVLSSGGAALLNKAWMQDRAKHPISTPWCCFPTENKQEARKDSCDYLCFWVSGGVVGTSNRNRPWPWEFGEDVCSNWIWERWTSLHLRWYNWEKNVAQCLFFIYQKKPLYVFYELIRNVSTAHFPRTFWAVTSVGSSSSHYCCCSEQGCQLHLHTMFFLPSLLFLGSAVKWLKWCESQAYDPQIFNSRYSLSAANFGVGMR